MRPRNASSSPGISAGLMVSQSNAKADLSITRRHGSGIRRLSSNIEIAIDDTARDILKPEGPSSNQYWTARPPSVCLASATSHLP